MKFRSRNIFINALFVLCFVVTVVPIQAQLNVEAANTGLFTPEDLINNVFLGSGLEVTNVNYVGANNQVGFFSNGMTSIGIEQGLILSTGNAIDAAMANNLPNTTGPGNGVGNDVDLEGLIPSGSVLNDICSYEISFIPTGDTITFSYVFASEEYPEFTCSPFNDVFGFFITGPNPAGGNYNGENIALVPDPLDPSGNTFTTVPVTINNVNGGGINPPDCNFDFVTYYNDNAGSNLFAYDGYLNVLKVKAAVDPCEEYVMKLAVADVGDGALDTGIFLEGKSFGGNFFDVAAISIAKDGVLSESCAEGSLDFSLPLEANQDVEVTFNVIGTAIMGTDYGIIPTTITIPQGSQTFTIPIIVFEDGIVEGQETIGIDIQVTPCKRDTFWFYLEDSRLVEPSLPDVISSCDGPVQLDGTLPIPLPDPDIFTNTTGGFIPTIPTNNPPPPGTVSPLCSAIDVFGVQPTTLTDGVIKEVCINIEHGFDGDLDVFLFSPSGAFMELTTDNGGFGDNYVNTCFRPDAIDTISSGGGFTGQAPSSAAPFTGKWLPETPFQSLYSGSENNPTNGEWVLKVKDDTPTGNGDLIDWSICFYPLYDLTYSWAPAAGLSCTDCPNPIADPAATTTYVLTVRDVYGCEVLDSVTIERAFNTEPAVVTSINCPDDLGSVTVNILNGGVPPFTFDWGIGTDSILTNVPAGIYSVTMTDVLGCTAEQEVVLPGPPPITITTNSTDACSSGPGSGTAMVTPAGGTSGFTYQWDASAGNSTNPSVSNLTPGTYMVTVFDGNLCPKDTFVTVGASAPITTSFFGDSTNCFGEANAFVTVLPMGGNETFTYQWSDGLGTNPMVSGLGAGSYSVVVTDGNLCSTTAFVNVKEMPEMFFDITAVDPACFAGNDGTITLDAVRQGGANVNLSTLLISWSNDATNISPLNDGLSAAIPITLTITDQIGCQKDTTIQLVGPTPISVTETLVQPSCFGENTGAISIVPNGGNAPLVIDWGFAMGNTVTMLTAGSYTVTITDATSCTFMETFVLTNPDELTATVSQLDACPDGAILGSATIMPTGGTGAYSYQWDASALNATSPTASNLSIGNYAYTVTDANNCPFIGNVMINESPAIVATLVGDTLNCFGQTDANLEISATGGNGGFEYTWSNGLGTTPSVSNLPNGEYTVITSDANNCTTSNTINVTSTEALLLDLTFTDPLCFNGMNGMANLNQVNQGTGTVDLSTLAITWTSSTNTNPMETGLNALAPVTVSILDQNGCPEDSTFQLNNPAELTLVSDLKHVDCPGGMNGKIEIMATGGTGMLNYNWNASGITGTSISGLTAGPYPLVITDENACPLDSIFVINQPDSIKASVDVDNPDCSGEGEGSIDLTISGGTPGYQVAWDNGESGMSISNLQPGLYAYTITDAKNCEEPGVQEITGPDALGADISIIPVRCFGDKNGRISFEMFGGTAPFTYRIDSMDWLGNSSFIGLDTGFYDFEIMDSRGCVLTLDSIEVEGPDEFVLNLGGEIDLLLGSDYTLNIEIEGFQGSIDSIDWYWDNSDTSFLSCLTCFDPTIEGLLFSKIFQLTLVDEFGCPVEDYLRVSVEKPRIFYIPTGFTPNDDGNNDLLLTHGDERGIVKTFSIHDRWGTLVHQQSGFNTGDSNFFWDGSYRGKLLDSGVFVWYAQIEFIDGSVQTFHGEVTLIR